MGADIRGLDLNEDIWLQVEAMECLDWRGPRLVDMRGEKLSSYTTEVRVHRRQYANKLTVY